MNTKASPGAPRAAEIQQLSRASCALHPTPAQGAEPSPAQGVQERGCTSAVHSHTLSMGKALNLGHFQVVCSLLMPSRCRGSCVPEGLWQQLLENSNVFISA